MKMLRIVPVMLALAPGVALAQSAFDGHWKVDLGTAQLPAKPDVILLKDGVYSCSTCIPALSVKADGQPHPAGPSPYYDAAAVTVLGPNAIEGMHLKGGVVTGRMITTVSPDGQTEVMKYTDLTVPASPVTGELTYTRVGAAPPGAHAISGQWRQAASHMSDNALVLDVVSHGDRMSVSSPSGQSYTALIGGPPAPYTGDPGVTAVTLAYDGPRGLVETDYRDGKPVSVERMTLAPGGQKVTVVTEDKLRGTTSTVTMIKQ